jgi:hypothetical protein
LQSHPCISSNSNHNYLTSLIQCSIWWSIIVVSVHQTFIIFIYLLKVFIVIIVSCYNLQHKEGTFKAVVCYKSSGQVEERYDLSARPLLHRHPNQWYHSGLLSFQLSAASDQRREVSKSGQWSIYNFSMSVMFRSNVYSRFNGIKPFSASLGIGEFNAVLLMFYNTFVTAMLFSVLDIITFPYTNYIHRWRTWVSARHHVSCYSRLFMHHEIFHYQWL